MAKMSLKEKLRAGLPLAATQVSMNDIMISDILASSPFDFIWVDTEHASIDYGSLLGHVIAVQGRGNSVVVRLQQHTPAHTKRVLEMGVDGIVFPMINTADEAWAAIKSTLYPPSGRRGYAPIRAAAYGALSPQQYADIAENTLVRFIQIETATAVENLDEIIAVGGVDGYILGPCDMSASLGVLGDIYNELSVSYLRNAAKKLITAGKRFGVATSAIEETTLSYWQEMGADILISGADFEHIRIRSCEALENMNAVLGKSKHRCG